jgi:hypothetical protein
MFKKPCGLTFVPADGSEEKPCTRKGLHGPFHASDTETHTRVPGGALVSPRALAADVLRRTGA